MSAGAKPLGRTGKRTLFKTVYLQFRASLFARSVWRATWLPAAGTYASRYAIRLFRFRGNGVAQIRREQDQVITGWISEQIR